MGPIRFDDGGILAPVSYWTDQLKEWLNCPKRKRIEEINTELRGSAYNDLSHRFNLIREAYKLSEGMRYDPYLVTEKFTPIELHLWQDIRSFCRQVRMYPQYPVGKYFVDFGDPWKKVAIEADGKQWHDEEKDRIRDQAIEYLGWTIYHIKGCDTIKEGVIEPILQWHYNSGWRE